MMERDGGGGRRRKTEVGLVRWKFNGLRASHLTTRWLEAKEIAARYSTRSYSFCRHLFPPRPVFFFALSSRGTRTGRVYLTHSVAERLPDSRPTIADLFWPRVSPPARRIFSSPRGGSPERQRGEAEKAQKWCVRPWSRSLIAASGSGAC